MRKKKEMEKIKVPSTSFMVTEACTLKCKLCLAYVPYYKKHTCMTELDMKKVLERYFLIVDEVEKMSLTGGEPLLNVQINEMLLEIFKYSERITKEIILITNGTIPFTNELLDIMVQNDKLKVIVNNYGKLSLYAEENYYRLCQKNIRAILYTEDNRYGWIDCRDHSLKHESVEAKEKQAAQCAFFQGKKYVINRGKLYTCTRAAYRIQEGIIPYTEEAYIDLLDETQSVELQKKKLKELLGARYTISCAFCDGLTENSVKYKAAEQLETEE